MCVGAVFDLRWAMLGWILHVYALKMAIRRERKNVRTQKIILILLDITMYRHNVNIYVRDTKKSRRMLIEMPMVNMEMFGMKHEAIKVEKNCQLNIFVSEGREYTTKVCSVQSFSTKQFEIWNFH